MGWSVGRRDGRDIGYGVPAICDKPDCDAEIDRGLSYCCGDYSTEYGCGLYFCENHLSYRKPHGSDRLVQLCPRCIAYKNPYTPKPDTQEWISWKLTDDSWNTWRQENPKKVALLEQRGR